MIEELENDEDLVKINKYPDTIEKQLDDLRKDMRILSEKVIILEQKINNDTSIKKDPEKENKKEIKKSKKIFWVGEIAFYALLICIVLGAFLIKSNGDGRPTSFAGFSMFTVLTGSMQSEIPKGSFVITKYVEPENLKIGDDITYMANERTTVTHRIIAIVEKFQDTGKRAFETQGVMNAKPDKNLVPASNLVGKVVFHSKFLGDMANFIGKNWPFVIFVVVVIFIIGFILKKILNQDYKTDNNHLNLKKRRFKIRRNKTKERK